MNSLEVGIHLVAGVLLILVNGFFVAIEFALTRARQFTEEEFVGDGHRALEQAWEMTHNLEARGAVDSSFRGRRSSTFRAA